MCSRPPLLLEQRWEAASAYVSRGALRGARASFGCLPGSGSRLHTPSREQPDAGAHGSRDTEESPGIHSEHSNVGLGRGLSVGATFRRDRGAAVCGAFLRTAVGWGARAVRQRVCSEEPPEEAGAERRGDQQQQRPASQGERGRRNRKMAAHSGFSLGF
ncbi:hypothetical protein CB1_001222008 [Camelus ferus]|nr:hypothetical protein CB1_001222008 [Camelus ferus]